MATWGPARGRSRSGASHQPARSAPRASARTLSDEPSGPTTRRAQAGAELRDAVSGRESEFWGIGLIAVGVLIALAIYFGLAGPLGDGIDALFAWISGIGRFVLPPTLIAIGVTLVRSGRSEHRFRMAIGIGVTAWAVLGLLHVARTSHVNFDSRDAGGWLGLALGSPMRSLIGAAGAVVVLLAVILIGLMLVTGLSARTLWSVTSQAVRSIARPMGRRAGQALRDMSTLKSEREGSDAPDETWADTATATLPAPVIYDAADDFAEPPARRTRARRSTPAPYDGDGDAMPASDATSGWTLPPANLLRRSEQRKVDSAEVAERGRTLVEALASHGVDTTLIGQMVGPTVTRYELELGTGVKVARVTSLSRDIAYALAAGQVRILAPIPGRSAIGVEVPNHTRHLVSLGDVMASPEAKSATEPLDVAIGKDVAGRSVFLDLAATPHLLIAGQTGSGKSSGINCILTSLLMRCTPDEVRLILIDPKQVEMNQYNRLPHLLTAPVTDPKKAANALAWAVKEMEQRFDRLAEAGFRDIKGYNRAYDAGTLDQSDPYAAPELPGDDPVEPAPERYPRMSYIVVVVDELNDLMMVAQRDVEDSITRIAQKARAVGIHLVVATQRPSAQVITGVIKANIPARMAFAVASHIDSRVILDQIGAEDLIGKGDMLLLGGDGSVAHRIQGSFVSEDEIRAVAEHWRRQGPEPEYVSGVDAEGPSGGLGAMLESAHDDDDEDAVLVRQAMELVVRSQLGSTSMLQRKLKIGFARAGRVMDLLEQRGVVGPSEGSKARAVLMTVEEFELIQQAERER